MGKLYEILTRMNALQRVFVVCWVGLIFLAIREPDWYAKASIFDIIKLSSVLLLIGVPFYLLIPKGGVNHRGVEWWRPEFTFNELFVDIYALGAQITWVVLFLAGYIYAIIEYGFFLGLGLGWIPAVFCALIGALLWPLFVIGLIVLYNLFPDEASALLALMTSLMGGLFE